MKLRFFHKIKTSEQDTEHIGKLSVVQVFYEGPSLDEDEGINWVEWAPPSLPAPKKKKYEGAAVQVYKRLDKKADVGITGTQNYYTDRIRLQSPFLHDALETTLSRYGLHFDDALGYADSFGEHRALFFAREKIAELSKTAEDEMTRSHCHVLVEVIQQNLSDTLNHYDQFEKNQKISFSILWTLFPQGSVFATTFGGRLRAFRVKACSGVGPIIVNCESISFDGMRYGLESIRFSYPRFEGKIETLRLSPYPVYVLEQFPDISLKLNDRGLRLLDYQVPCYRTWIPEIKTAVEGQGLKPLLDDTNGERIVIDCYQHRILHGLGRGQPLEPLPSYSEIDLLHVGEPDNGTEGRDTNDMKLSRPTNENIAKNREVILKDTANLLILSPFLKAYRLAAGFWSNAIHVDDIFPLEPNSTTYHRVVFDEKKKEVVKFLAEQYLNSNGRYDDLIAGKGQALLFLFSGTPGTGKTLMAEALADHLNRPLLRIGSLIGDVGNGVSNSNAYDFENKVRTAKEWGGLILFDDAGFLSERRNQGQSNLISAFVRHIEYFKGIVFLTTNFSESIDDALKSRLHVHLVFSPLSAPMRVRVWQNFVERLPESLRTLTVADIESLGKWKLNGREIKNVMNMTVALCQKSDKRLSVDAVEDLIALASPFASKELDTSSSTATVEKAIGKDETGLEELLLDL
ncbi:P-loop containing nucleoside triphosphate hydrolase protein [Xylariaceae sp. AK1471]|nr:P-loop containing nucleoside triphosphate hydrolase protein [Xylariaceae sp. AK1471]